MIRKWDVDDRFVVEAKTGMFGRTLLSINGKPVPGKLTTRRKSELIFTLPDNRRASMAARPQFGTRPEMRLTVDGRLMLETGKKPIKCDACGVTVKPNDRYCGGCGHEMPSPETSLHRANLSKATKAIMWLSVLFLASGILMFFVGNQNAEKALSHLAGMDPAAAYPKLIDGHTYTVAEVRAKILWEPRSILIVDGILAAIMGGLALWGRHSPLPAILIAAAVYAVVSVVTALSNPATIGQGIYVKIVVIALLVRGIKAALALRTANA
jgi:hypothetical protein